jgi:hypothetical protein
MNRDDVLVWLSLAWLVALCGTAIWAQFWPAYDIFRSPFSLAALVGRNWRSSRSSPWHALLVVNDQASSATATMISAINVAVSTGDSVQNGPSTFVPMQPTDKQAGTIY